MKVPNLNPYVFPYLYMQLLYTDTMILNGLSLKSTSVSMIEPLSKSLSYNFSNKCFGLN